MNTATSAQARQILMAGLLSGALITIHVAIAIASSNHHPDPNVVIGGFMSHFLFAVPMTLVIKRHLSSSGADLMTNLSART